MSDTRATLEELEMPADFVRRHIGPGEEQINEMLAGLSLKSLDDLVSKAVPESIISDTPLALEPAMSERETVTYLRRMRERNQIFVSMIGMGYYGTVLPAVIKRNVLENPGWYTAYTPYQAEVSQGRLEALLNFQQMVVDLTGMDLANASLLDEATAAAEAMAMSRRVSKSKSNMFFVSDDCHPQTIAVVRTRARSMGYEVIVGEAEKELAHREVFGVLLQYPGSGGEVRDLRPLIEQAHQRNILVTVAADILALTLLMPPGQMGADIAIGSTQRFGVPMGYGGPHAAYFATRDKFKRSTPGRIIGVSKDSMGRPALRMALQTREQHIRREKATSNICYSSGSAGNHRCHVWHLSWARWSKNHRRASTSPNANSGCGTARAGFRGVEQKLLRHRHGAGAWSGSENRRQSTRVTNQSQGDGRRPPRHIIRRDDPAQQSRSSVESFFHRRLRTSQHRAVRQNGRRHHSATVATHERIPNPPRVQSLSRGNRNVALLAPGCRRRTSHSTAP